MRERQRRGGSRREGDRGGRRSERKEGRPGGCGGFTGVLGGWVLVRFSRGKRRRGVRAASGWCIIDPSVCGLGKKRSLRLGPRKRQSDTPPAYGGEKETPPRRPISQTDIRNAFASYPAAPADESTRRIEERGRKKDIHPRCGEFTPGWIIRSRWRSIGVSEDGTARGVPREIARGIIQS